MSAEHDASHGATDLLRWGAATDIGRARTASDNEDAFTVGPNLFVVADGMGGHAAGEVASALAVQVMDERLSDGASSMGVAVAATVEANAAIFHAAHRDAAHRGMGTTITAITLLHPPANSSTADAPARMAVINVGDSRTYIVRDGALRRLSIDHSYVQELLATGHITEHEARAHPRRNIITRALGIEPFVRVDAWAVNLVRGDRFVLCSDGLVDEVDDDTIAAVVDHHDDDPQACADALVDTANAAGGRDNITVVVVDVIAGKDPGTDDLLLSDDAWDDDDTSLITADDPTPPATPAALARRGSAQRATESASAPPAGGARNAATRNSSRSASRDTSRSASHDTSHHSGPGASPIGGRTRRRRFAAAAVSVLVATGAAGVVVALTHDDATAPTTTSTTTPTATTPATTAVTVPATAPATTPASALVTAPTGPSATVLPTLPPAGTVTRPTALDTHTGTPSSSAGT